MGKKEGNSKKYVAHAKPYTRTKTSGSSSSNQLNPLTQLPPLTAKDDLVCKVLEEDQIILIPNVFNPDECKRYVDFIDAMPLELTPAPKKGEAVRENYRISIPSQEFADKLFSILSPHLPSFPYPASLAPRNAMSTERRAHSLNANIRLYKYVQGQHFGRHYDDSVRGTRPGTRSEWTLLIYLSGIEDGVVGGETIFYKGQGKRLQEIRAPLNCGSALLHRHGHECLLHEGSAVIKGTKYVLRSDIMFTI